MVTDFLCIFVAQIGGKTPVKGPDLFTFFSSAKERSTKRYVKNL